MRKGNKRQPQGELFAKKRPKKRGRKRVGRGSPSHRVRPELKPNLPVHVVLRAAAVLGGLRKRHIYHALRDATITVALRELAYDARGAFRIIHLSVQQTHIHLLVEADDKYALSRGMQSFQISAAKNINRAFSRQRKLTRRRRGSVFPDRFHQEIITNPTQARRALSYVLNNWRKHREDQSEQGRQWNVDPFSTGVLFKGWKEREGAEALWRWRDTYDPMVVHVPKTWLLSVGWRKAGTISYRDIPSTPPVPERALVAA